jgi:hypothetical protein
MYWTAVAWPCEQSSEPFFALGQRFRPIVLAVPFQQIEGAQPHCLSFRGSGSLIYVGQDFILLVDCQKI